MLLQTANFLTHKEKEHQSSNLEVYKGLRTIENEFLQRGLGLSGSLDILRGAWKPPGRQPASRRIGGPAQKSGAVVMENERQMEDIKRQVANNPVG